MKRVYLDQNKWIDLSKCVAGREDGKRYEDIHKVLTYGVENGLVSCPLSGEHYMQTAKRANPQSRHRLAAAMAALSQFDAIAPPNRVVPMELDEALRDRYGRPQTVRTVPIFGKGFRHALGWDYPLYEVPAHVPIEPDQKAAFEQSARDFMEYAALAGPGDRPFISAELAPQLDAFGDRYVEAEQRLAEGLAKESSRREAGPRFAAASELVDILPGLNEALDRASLGVGTTADLDSKEAMTALLMELPSRSVVYDLRRRRLANPQTKWEPNDLDDLSALGVAIAYCDIVVTEKQWVRLAEEAGIGDRLNTTIISDLADLTALIV